MSTLQETIKGAFHHLLDRTHPHVSNAEGGTLSPLQPKTEEEIPWDKFRKYFAPLPKSFFSTREDQLVFGDAYLASRTSGKELVTVPILIERWRSKKSVVDMLLILGFNSQDQVVGMRTVAMDLTIPGFVEAEGAVASAVCNDGIGGVLEQVRHRASEEILTRYIDRGFPYSHMNYTIDDENKRVVSVLQEKAAQCSDDAIMKARFNHAQDDRPRWETLFNAEKSGMDQNGMVIRTLPNLTLNRGFRSEGRTAYNISRIPTTHGRPGWRFEDLGDEAYQRIVDRGFFDKEYLYTKMAEAVTSPPEV